MSPEEEAEQARRRLAGEGKRADTLAVMSPVEGTTDLASAVLSGGLDVAKGALGLFRGAAMRGGELAASGVQSAVDIAGSAASAAADVAGAIDVGSVASGALDVAGSVGGAVGDVAGAVIGGVAEAIGDSLS